MGAGLKRAAVNADFDRNRALGLRVSISAMKQLNTPHRSALTAIAAVLMLGSTSAVAQDMPSGSEGPAAASPAVPATAPEIVVPSAQPAPAPVMPAADGGLAPITAAPPVVQSAPAITQAPIVNAAPVAQATAEPRAERRAATQRTAEPVTAPAAQVARATPTTAPAETAAPSTEAMPGIAPSELMAMEQGEAAAPAQPVAQVPPAVTSDSNTLAIVGGAGAVLLLGGAAYALHRRRKTQDSEAVVTAYEPRSTPLDPVPTTVVTRDGIVPIATVDTPAQVREPVIAPSAPQFARSAAPAADRDLEAVAAAAPTADNPFLTRKNRLRRAHFLRNHEQDGHDIAATQAAKTPEMAKAAQAQTQRSAQPVYSFGKAPVTFRPAGLKPSTT